MNHHADKKYYTTSEQVCHTDTGRQMESDAQHAENTREGFMAGAEEGAQAIGGLLIGGIIFIAFGSALAGSTLEESWLINFEVWGVLYILAAIVLGIVFVGGILASLFNSL